MALTNALFSPHFPLPMRCRCWERAGVKRFLYFSLSGVVSLHLVLIGEWRRHLSLSLCGSCSSLLSTAFTTAFKSYFIYDLFLGDAHIYASMSAFSILLCLSIFLSFSLTIIHSISLPLPLSFSSSLSMPPTRIPSLPPSIPSPPYINSPDILYISPVGRSFSPSRAPHRHPPPPRSIITLDAPCIPCRQH